MRKRFGTTWAQGLPGSQVVAEAGTWGEALPQPASALGAVVALWAGAAAAWTAVVGLVVIVVTQAEEPHEPEDEQSHVENAEAHHEDPALRTDSPIVDPWSTRCQVGSVIWLCSSAWGPGCR
jgi:hypothetical protein